MWEVVREGNALDSNRGVKEWVVHIETVDGGVIGPVGLVAVHSLIQQDELRL